MVTYLCYPPLHNDKVWIVDIKLNRLEECLDLTLLGFVTIQKVLGDVWNSNLYKKVTTTLRKN